jgi:hypothetical protein
MSSPPLGIEELEKVVDALVKAAWKWGKSCGIDDVPTMEARGDSYNEWQRDETAKAKALVLSLIERIRELESARSQPSAEAGTHIPPSPDAQHSAGARDFSRVLGESYVIVSLKHTKPGDRYVSFWRPDGAGYCWPLAWAGAYSEEEARRIDASPDSDSIAVPLRIALLESVPPERGYIDGDAGPVVTKRRLARLVAARLPPRTPQVASEGSRDAPPTSTSGGRVMGESLEDELRAEYSRRADDPMNHDWGSSPYGHGDAACRLCGITNREAAALGILNCCESNDSVAAPPRAAVARVHLQDDHAPPLRPRTAPRRPK